MTLTKGSPPAFRSATPKDAAAIVRLMTAYYAEDGYPIAAARADQLIRHFLEHPELGSFWVAASGDAVIGYLIVTLGFSFEYGGRDAFIDELYIAEGFRSAGLGRQALNTAEDYCRRADVRAMHLEVETHRIQAASLYQKRGFHDTGRRLMSKRLAIAGD